MTEEEIFAAAAELPPAQRAAYLDDACRDEPALRARLEMLLRFHDSEGFMNHCAAGPDAPDPREQSGARIGRYRLLQQIGEGGFGVVWMAEQVEPVVRRVALKIIKAGMDTREVIARFEAERQALALMNHPNIAKVHDAGATDTGRPYFVMELVHGIPITGFCDEQRFTTRQRLELFIEVCSAINHAHQKGVIHRDLKPSNILVTQDGERPAAKVIDFGIAKATQGSLTDKTLLTRFEQLLGTPAYMSPEQAGLGTEGIDTRSDIYSLGVLLYELLTGKPPFDAKSLMQAGYDEIRRIIREVDPPRPSLRLTTMDAGERASIARAHNTDSEKLGCLLHGDLDWIALKALEKDRGRRYQSANDFAEDIHRHLNDEPVVAAPPSWSYRLRKFVRRRRAPLAAGAVALLALCSAALVSVRSASAARAALAETHYNVGLGWMRRADMAEEQGKRYPDTLLYAAQAIGFDGLGRPEGGEEPVRYFSKKRNPEDYWKAREWIASRPAYLPVWSSGSRTDEPVTAMAVDLHGRWVAVGSEKGLRVIELPTGTDAPVSGIGGVMDLALHPDGELLAVAATGGIRMWNVAKREFADGPDGAASALAWSPGGDVMVGAGEDGSILVWREGTGVAERISTAQPIEEANEDDIVLIPGPLGPAEELEFSPENGFLAVRYLEASPRVVFPYDLAMAQTWFKSLGEEARSLAVRPDGRILALGTNSGRVRFWELEGSEAPPFNVVSPEFWHDAGVTAMAFRDDGAELASGSEDGEIKLWNVESVLLDESEVGMTVFSLMLKGTLHGHRGAVRHLAHAPGGKLLASAGTDGSVCLWEVSGGVAEPLNLYEYVSRDWYGIDPEVRWLDGRDEVGLGAGDISERWRRQSGDEAPSLLRDLAQAARERRWRRFDLRAFQLERLGEEVPGELRVAREAAIPHGEKAGDRFTNGEGMELVWCPPTGDEGFFMGSPAEEVGRASGETQHRVALTSGFWLGKYEVTQAQWAAVMGRNPANYQESPLNPVEMVNWGEAMRYCQQLTDRERMRGTLLPGWEYSLPTEVQWEYACRAGTRTAWSFGADPSAFARYGNFNDRNGGFETVSGEADMSQIDGYKYAAPVGTYRPNAWGLHDMHGNVWEWCRDGYDAYSEEGEADSASLPSKVFRGGSWLFPAADCRSAVRTRRSPGYRYDDLGCRVALVPSNSGMVGIQTTLPRRSSGWRRPSKDATTSQRDDDLKPRR